MIVLVILQKLKIVPGKSIARQTKEKWDSLKEYSVFEVCILTAQCTQVRFDGGMDWF
jgi:hypothetical protein